MSLFPESFISLADAARIRHRFIRAEQLAQQVAGAGDTDAIARPAEIERMNRAEREAGLLLEQAADAGSTNALIRLAVMKAKAGHRHEAEDLTLQAAAAGDTRPLVRLAELRELAGVTQGAERLGRLAATAGDTSAVVRIAEIRETGGRIARNEARRLHQRADRAGDASALARLAAARETAGCREEAGQVARRARQKPTPVSRRRRFLAICGSNVLVCHLGPLPRPARRRSARSWPGLRCGSCHCPGRLSRASHSRGDQ